MKKTNQIGLGDIAKDTITGFQGVVTTVAYFLNGCVRLNLKLKAGAPLESVYFDVEQLVLVKSAKPRVVKPSGGPFDAPSRNEGPKR